MSVEFISWINEQLKTEIARREGDSTPDVPLAVRAQAMWTAMLSGVSLTLVKWLQW